MVCFLSCISKVQWLIKDVKKLPLKEMGAGLRMCWKDSLRPRSHVKQTKILIERDPHRMPHTWHSSGCVGTGSLLKNWPQGADSKIFKPDQQSQPISFFG